MASKNSSSNSIKEMTWLIACFWWMIFGETQVTFISGCPGKKVPSKTLISIFFSWGGGKPLPLRITSLTLLVHEETLIKDKISFLIHTGMLLMFLIFVNSGIKWYRRFHIQPLFFLNMKSCQQIYFSGLIHSPRGNFLGGLGGYKRCLISILCWAEWTSVSPPSAHTLFHINHVIDLISSGFKSFFFFKLRSFPSPRKVSVSQLTGRLRLLDFARHEIQQLGSCNEHSHLF